MRDEAAEYLDKKAADLKRLGVAKVTCVTKEGFAADEIILLGRKTAGQLDRDVFARAIRRQTLGVGECRGNGGAPLRAIQC